MNIFSMIKILQNGKARMSLLFIRIDKYWPESSGLGNVVDFRLATLPMALQKNFSDFCPKN